jgi:hypothetical protein
LAAVATRTPVAPPPQSSVAASEVALYVPSVDFASQRSVMPAGGVIAVAGPVPKIPMSMLPAAAVIEGAVMEVEEGFT